MIKIRFISNFFNHHQKPLCDAFVSCGVDFKFYSTSEMPEEQLRLGYEQLTEQYVEHFMSSKEQIRDILSSDAVIFAYKPSGLLKQCLDKGILTFIYTERLFKRRRWKAYLPTMIMKYRSMYMSCKSMPYILCAGAYVKDDFAIFGFPKERCFKWGYFPESSPTYIQRNYNVKLNIIWVGRFIDWKHPDIAVKVSKSLEKKNIPHHLHMLGTGYLIDKIRRYVVKNHLKNITLHGAVPATKVKAYMSDAHILLMTSDEQEGWGAVVNEGMSCGCIVIASNKEGSIPYLIQDKVNGYVYCQSKVEDIVEIIESNYKYGGFNSSVSNKAVDTIVNEWNEVISAQRLINFIKFNKVESSGPLSLA